MAKPKWQDPEKRAEKARRKKARRAQEAASGVPLMKRERPRAQLDHATNPAAQRKARDGQRAMERERG